MNKILAYFKKLKLGIKVIITIFLLYTLYSIFSLFGAWPSVSSWFKSQKITIDETPILVQEIKKISQLFTVTAYDEIVQDSSYFSQPNTQTILQKLTIKQPLLVTNKIVLITKGKIMAGTDLALINEAAIFTKGDSINIQLPAAVILEAIINPSDVEIFEEKGSWPQELIAANILSAKQKMIIRAKENKIIEKANEQAKIIISNFLKSCGFKKVEVFLK
jgi:hypothetical protein